MKRVAIFAAFALTGGCATLGGNTTSIVSAPPGAFVTVEGYGECQTPCRVALDAPRMVSVAKAGFKTQRFQIIPGRRRVSVVLELVAPTKDVESQEMPEIRTPGF